jgi:hypothetical protein
MKGFIDDELDLDVLCHAVDRYASDLPTDIAEILLEGVKAVQHQEPHAVANLVEQLRQHKALDRIYERSLRDLRQNYTAQERAKSLVLTLDRPLEPKFKNIIDDLIAKIERAIDKNKTLALNAAPTQVLKALEKSYLSIEDLAYTIDFPQATTQEIVQKLWEKGYIDYLKSSILYILFPSLRKRKHRQIAPDAFLTLTAKGYFHLNPLFKRPDAEAIA